MTKHEDTALLAIRDADLAASGLATPALIKKHHFGVPLDAAATAAMVGWDAEKVRAGAYEIPYFDIDGKVNGFARWKILPLDDEPPFRYFQEPKTIPRIYWSPLVDWRSVATDVGKRIVLTEGEKKAACACKHGIVCIGLGGVWNWKSRKWGLDKIPDFDSIEWQGREVEVCFDGDLHDNEDVRRACDSLLAMLVKKGVRAFVRYMPNKDGTSKLDDFLLKHGAARYEKLDRVEWSRLLVDPPTNPMPNARRILKDEFDHPDQALLLHQGNVFYHWNSACWPLLDEATLRATLYTWAEDKGFLRETGKGVVHEPFAPNIGKVANLTDALRAVTHLADNVPVPAWLDDRERPPARELISCTNGLLHWPTRKLHPHTPLFYCRYTVPFDFDPKAPQPKRWLAFLDELWPKDPESVRTLQEVFGYLISGDTRLHKMFLLVGPKRGGKGTIGRVLTALLGAHNVAGPTLASLGGSFGLWPLIDKPVAIVSDARIGTKSDGSAITERLLAISGEDTLTVDRKYLTAWTGKMPTRILVLSNELPRFTDSSGAVASRFVVLQLAESFYGRENTSLTEELCAELSGILNWALEGLKELRKRGKFVQPKLSQDAVREMEDLGSPVMSFVRECCVVGAEEWVETEELYRDWCRWCLRTGHQSGAKETFAKNLRAAQPEIRRQQRGTGKNKKWALVGVGLQPELRKRNHVLNKEQP